MERFFFVVAFSRNTDKRYPFEILGVYPTHSLATDIKNIQQKKFDDAYKDSEIINPVSVRVVSREDLLFVIDSWGAEHFKT